MNDFTCFKEKSTLAGEKNSSTMHLMMRKYMKLRIEIKKAKLLSIIFGNGSNTGVTSIFIK